MTDFLILHIELVLRIAIGFVHDRSMIESHVVALLLKEVRQRLFGTLRSLEQLLKLRPQVINRLERIRVFLLHSLTYEL